MKNFILLRIYCRWKNQFRWNYFEIKKTLSQVIVCNIKLWNFYLLSNHEAYQKHLRMWTKWKINRLHIKNTFNPNSLFTWIFHLKISRKIYALNLRWEGKIQTQHVSSQIILQCTQIYQNQQRKLAIKSMGVWRGNFLT